MKKKSNRCATKHCLGELKDRSLYCRKCRKRKSRDADPVKAHYSSWKSNAKARGKSFTITLEEFRDFCAQTNYMELKGQGNNDLTIDRIREELGYSRGNIQALSAIENKAKYRQHLRKLKGWAVSGLGRQPGDPF